MPRPRHEDRTLYCETCREYTQHYYDDSHVPYAEAVYLCNDYDGAPDAKPHPGIPASEVER